MELDLKYVREDSPPKFLGDETICRERIDLQDFLDRGARTVGYYRFIEKLRRMRQADVRGLSILPISEGGISDNVEKENQDESSNT